MKFKSITTIFLIIIFYILIVHPDVGLSKRSTKKKKSYEKKPYKKKYIKIRSSKCKLSGFVKIIPKYNLDELYGIITFNEVIVDNKYKNTQIEGMFTTPFGLAGLKTNEGNYIYTAELYHENKIHDITEPMFNGATELVTKVPKLTNFTICGKNSIIGKTMVIKKDDEEIAISEISGLESFLSNINN
ncbi:3567_t:CDS:1 [Gigaspora margarita]|uniref:3567_t:CDS:1 n=1 Tax=Gigaspora margarita TaxID=4874 RepID=A0ABN7ULM7_GIGMA|nr:3567_t:CDS:1 [Gigaspora margarita]